MLTTRRYGISILIALLISIYTLTNAGRYHIVDELSLFAVTESLALHGAVDTNAIAWTQWVNSPGEVLGAFGPDGQVYSKKGPAPAFLAVPWYLLLRWIAKLNISVGLFQGSLLWNGLITAWTAALLWRCAVRLGYSDRTGAFLGLLFGLGTIAWPYAKTFFGEPLSALALLTMFYGILTYSQSRLYRWVWLAGIGAGLAIATVTAHALLVAILALYTLWVAFSPPAPSYLEELPSQAARRSPYAILLVLPALALPLAGAGIFLLWYNFARFGDPFTTGYHFNNGEGFTTPLLQGLWGLLISPYRGLFWHTPLLLVSLIGSASFVRRHRQEGSVILALTLALVLLYSKWWMWWGGFAWGPRFLVSLTPFWVLLLAPLVETTVNQLFPAHQQPFHPGRWARRQRWGKLSVGGWLLLIGALVSFIVQLLAVSANYVNYEVQLRSLFPTDWSDPLRFGPPAQRLTDFFVGPVFGQWQLIRQGLRTNTDLAWLQADGAIHWMTVLIGLAVLITLGIAAWSWWGIQRDSTDATEISALVRWSLPLLPVILIGVWLGESSRDPTYGVADKGYRAILAEICTQVQANDVMVTVAPNSYHIPMNWMAGLCPKTPYLFGYATNSLDHPEAQQVMQKLVKVYDRIWFVTSGLPVNDPDNTLEHWLATVAYKADDRWYDDYRLVRYGTGRQLQGSMATPLDIFLRDDQGSQVTIQSARILAAAAPGAILPVEITYRLDAPAPANLHWFVQLLNSAGQAVAQVDTAPDDGYTPFSTLLIGQPVIERVGLPLPMNLLVGQYQLIAGLYAPDVPNAPRLTMLTGRDHVDLAVITVP